MGAVSVADGRRRRTIRSGAPSAPRRTRATGWAPRSVDRQRVLVGPGAARPVLASDGHFAEAGPQSSALREGPPPLAAPPPVRGPGARRRSPPRRGGGRATLRRHPSEGAAEELGRFGVPTFVRIVLADPREGDVGTSGPGSGPLRRRRGPLPPGSSAIRIWPGARGAPLGSECLRRRSSLPRGPQAPGPGRPAPSRRRARGSPYLRPQGGVDSAARS